VVAQPCLPKPLSPSFKHQAKASRMIQDQSSTTAHLYDYERERVP